MSGKRLDSGGISVVHRIPRSFRRMSLRRFTVLAYLKCFVGLCKDRLEGLMASPRATVAAHCRTLALLVPAAVLRRLLGGASHTLRSLSFGLSESCAEDA